MIGEIPYPEGRGRGIEMWLGHRLLKTPLIKLGPYSDIKGSSVRVAFVKRTSGAWSSGTESIKAERIAL